MLMPFGPPEQSSRLRHPATLIGDQFPGPRRLRVRSGMSIVGAQAAERGESYRIREAAWGSDPSR